MNRFTRTICLATIAAAIAVESTPAGAATLEGHWNLNEQALDQSGNNRDGTVLGDTSLTYASPDPLSLGVAGRFDASTDDAINVGNAGFGSLTNDYSIAGWIKPDQVAGIQRMFSGERVAGNTGYGIGTNGDNLRHTTYAVKDYDQGATVNAQQWQHLTVTVDSSNDARFYLDGALLGTVTHGSPAAASVNDFFIARTSPNGSATPSEEFTGRIDDVRVYSGVLTIGEVQGLATTPNLRGYWALDEKSGTTARDSSGYQSAGKITGTLQGGVTVNQASANEQFGTAMRFDGSNDEIFLGSALGSLTSNFTVSAWVNPSRLTGVQRVLSSSVLTGGTGWGFGLAGDDLRFTTFGKLDYNIAANLTLNEWTHIAVVFDSSFDAEFFVDGVSIGTIVGGAAAGATPDNFFIGRTGVQEAFQGLIDEVRVYNTALSDNDVARLAAFIPTPAALPAGLAMLGFAVMRRKRRA